MMVEQAKLQIVSEAILPTLLTGEKLYDSKAGIDIKTERETEVAGYQIVPVYDTLVARASWFNSGETTYGSLVVQIKEGIKEGQKDFLFDINSGGGEVTKCFSTCRELIALREEHGLNFVSVVNEFACSAAYAIACVAQKIYSVKGAEQGSIGVISLRLCQMKYDENLGVDYLIVRSKEEKALGNPHEKVSAKELENTKNALTIIDNEFNMYVKEQRGISVEAIQDMKGRAYFDSEALNLGLIDEVIPYLDSTFIQEKEKMSDNKVYTEQELATAVDTAKSVAVSEERKRIMDMQKLGTELGIPSITVARLISNGSDLETAKETFGIIREAYEEKASIVVEQRPTADSKSLAAKIGLE